MASKTISKVDRVSVAIDSNLHEALKKMAEKEGMTVSEVIRNAISAYLKLEGAEVSIDEIKMYSDLLSAREHVILDTDVWITILDELNERASDTFWEDVKKIGYEHGVEFKVRGCGCLEEALKLLSIKNLFKVKSENNVHSLVLTARNEHKFLKAFLSGLCEALGVEVETVESIRKIVIIEKSKNSENH